MWERLRSFSQKQKFRATGKRNHVSQAQGRDPPVGLRYGLPTAVGLRDVGRAMVTVSYGDSHH